MAPGGGNRLWRSILGAALLLSGLPAAQSAADEVQQNAEKLEFFEKKIRPLLIENCYACHSAETKPAGGLRVDDINGLRVGGESGAAVVPGNADDSLLLSRVLPDAKRRMPQDGKPLTEQQIADLKTWITDGAHWPVSDEHKPP